MKKSVLSVICFALCLSLMICVDIFSIDFSSIILILAGLVLGICVTALDKNSKTIKKSLDKSDEDNSELIDNTINEKDENEEESK